MRARLQNIQQFMRIAAADNTDAHAPPLRRGKTKASEFIITRKQERSQRIANNGRPETIERVIRPNARRCKQGFATLI